MIMEIGSVATEERLRGSSGQLGGMRTTGGTAGIRDAAPSLAEAPGPRAGT